MEKQPLLAIHDSSRSFLLTSSMAVCFSTSYTVFTFWARTFISYVLSTSIAVRSCFMNASSLSTSDSPLRASGVSAIAYLSLASLTGPFQYSLSQNCEVAPAECWSSSGVVSGGAGRSLLAVYCFIWAACKGVKREKYVLPM